MPKSSHQKLKILYLYQMLTEESDQQHPLTVKEMIARLQRQGISAERKSIYADLEDLRCFGLDIIATAGRSSAYFVGERTFEAPEVRLLVDAVQSSRFLTAKKSALLIKKLQTLTSSYEAKDLSQNVFVADRIKAMNESVYLTLDAVGLAIAKKKKVRFRYFEWDARGQKVFRRGGAFYTVSPFFLIWDDENYYLVALEENGERRHFRVDKMSGVEVLDEARTGEDKIASLTPSQVQKKTFGMFGGREERVTLWCAEEIAGPMFDRFGRDVVTRRADGGFTLTTAVVVSPRFFSYLAGFGDRVRILEPRAVRDEFISHCETILSAYQKDGEAKA